MIILIAESKTMRNCDMPVSAEEYTAHRPAYEEIASDTMNRIAQMPVGEIASEIKCSARQAAGILQMAYEFPNKNLGLPAIEAYTGVVFKAFEYASLSDNDKLEAISRLGIISSLYGWLKADDIIKNYRLDFNIPLAPGDKKFYDFWRKDVTIGLVREIQSSGERTILNLLPGDAAKCIDWKLVKRFAKVFKVDFKEIQDGGSFRTPTASRLKTLRGELLRNIITGKIQDPSELSTLSTDNLSPLGTPDYPDHIAFCC